MAFLWSAYELGSWKDLLPAGLGPISFKPAIEELLGAAHHDWLLETARNPIGLVLAREISAGRAIEAQVDWFPWTTGRQKIEGAAGFLREATKHFQVVIFSDDASRGFYQRLCRYRLLRNGCQVLNHFGPGEHAYFFYTAA